jgi:hypothetical protein
MKKVYKATFKTLLAGILMFTFQFASGQIVFTSTPDSSALVGEVYTYDVEVVATPASVTFSLDENPSGMTINASTGLITWTATSVTQGGKVVVKAVNSAGSFYQTYYVFVSDAISCPTGLLSYWKFDEALGAGDSVEDYAGSYAAYALSAMDDTAGMVDNGLKFRNTNQFLRVPDRNQYEWQRSSDFSFALWFKHIGSFENDEVFIARANGQQGAWIVLGIDHASQKLVFRLQTNWYLMDTTASGTEDVYFIPGNPISNNQWHHVAAVYDGNPNNGTDVTLKMYIDGVKYTVNRWLHAGYGFDGVNRDLTIGWFDPYSPTTFQFNGSMDEVSIFNKALSDAEANALYNNGLAHKATCQAGNHVPVITSTPVTAVNEDVLYTYTLVGRDYEATALTKTAVKKPSWLTFNASTGVLSGTARNANVGDTTVTLRVSDGQASVDQTFSLSVAAVNYAPVVTSTPEDSVKVGNVYTYQMVATDQDPYDELTYTSITKPEWLVFQPATGILTGIPTAANIGTHAVTLAVDDGTVTIDQSFNIIVYNITGLNDYESTNSLAGKIYPVPAKNEVNFSLNLNDKAQIQILTLTGKILKQIDVEASQKTATIDVSDLDAAVYLFRIIENNSAQVGKLIVE